MPDRRDAPDIVVLPPVLVGGVLLLGVALHYLLWKVTPFPLVPARVGGAALVGASVYLAFRAHEAMHRAGTNVFPTLPTLAIVDDGPYRRTRNPLYIAAMGVYLGVALWMDALVPLLLLPVVAAVLHWGVVLREERYLDAKFGDTYRAYRERVRRWV